MPRTVYHELQDDLFSCILGVHGSFSQEERDRFVALMNELGYNMTWNAIRYGTDLSVSFCPAFYPVYSSRLHWIRSKHGF